MIKEMNYLISSWKLLSKKFLHGELQNYQGSRQTFLIWSKMFVGEEYVLLRLWYEVGGQCVGWGADKSGISQLGAVE